MPTSRSRKHPPFVGAAASAAASAPPPSAPVASAPAPVNEPHRPPWYPNRDPSHNPWAVADTMTGKTHYRQWVDSLAPGELLRLIAEHQAASAQ